MLTYQKIIDRLSTSEKISILCDMQRLSEKHFQALGIPAICIGAVDSVRSDQYPAAAALSNSWNPALLEEIAFEQLQALALQGVNLAIVPGPKPKIAPAQSVLSEDPLLAASLAKAYVRAAGRLSMSVALDGYYVTAADEAWLDQPAEEAILQQFWVTPFKNAVEGSACRTFCTAGGAASKEGASHNLWLTAALRQQLGSDEAFFLCPQASERTASLLAHGILCCSGSTVALETALSKYQQLSKDLARNFIAEEDLAQASAEGQVISPEMLDNAVDQLLRFAFSLSKITADAAAVPVDPQQAAASTIVLLKKSLALPLRKKKICLVGDIGFSGSNPVIPALEALLTSEKRVITSARGYDLSTEKGEDLIAPAIEVAKTADCIVAFFGPSQEQQKMIPKTGKISIPASQQALLFTLSKLRKPIIAILPPEYCPDIVFPQFASSILLAPLNLPSSAQTLCDVLTGKLSPSGKLSSTVYNGSDALFDSHLAYKHKQGLKSGPFVGYRYYDTAGTAPAFPFGHGLSYSHFLVLPLGVHEQIAKVMVVNIGRIPAGQTVQLYLHKQRSNLVRPKKELVGFANVYLKPFQKEILEIPFEIPQVFNPDQSKFITEAGTYRLSIETSVNRIVFSKRIKVSGETVEPGNPRLCDFIQTESNILLDQYKLEAPYMDTTKTRFNIIAGSAAFLLAIVLKLYCAIMDISALFFDAFALALAISGVYFFIMAAINRRRKAEETKKAIEEAAKAAFDSANATTVPFYSPAEIFADASRLANLNDAAAPEAEEAEVDQLSFISKDYAFATAAKELATFAAERGCKLSEQTSFDLLSSLACSRLLIVHNMDSKSFKEFINVICAYFESNLYLDHVDSSYQSPEQLLFKLIDGQRLKTNVLKAIQSARTQPQLIHFAALDNVNPQLLSQFFMPYMKYVRNPKGSFHISAMNEYHVNSTYHIPENMWFVMNLAENEAPSKLPTSICDVAAVNQFSFDSCPISERTSEVRKFSFFQMEYLTDSTLANSTIPENHWKKLDKLDKAVSPDLPILDNKLWLSLETYAHVYLACSNDITQALDHAVSAKMLVCAIEAFQKESNDQSLADLVEQILGEEGSIACKKLIRSCAN